MTDDEIEQLWAHHMKDVMLPGEQGDESLAEWIPLEVLTFARDIERRERAACANEIHEGHHEHCRGAECDCMTLHQLLRAREDEGVRATVIATGVQAEVRRAVAQALAEAQQEAT